jgi:hypothetical protein
MNQGDYTIIISSYKVKQPTICELNILYFSLFSYEKSREVDLFV